jgi:peroxiredoxin
MTRLVTALSVGALVVGVAAAGRPHAAPAVMRVGSAAPAFRATDDRGVAHALADYRGKFVVLEWHNNGCPYVQKHYNSGNMQTLQKTWTAKGVVWLTIVSSAPGTQGYVTPAESQAFVKTSGAAPTAVLLDPDGTVGHLYEATNTPQMFVIDPKGTLIYDGAIDNRPTPDPASLAGATNYVSAALTAAMAGKPVATPTTVPYGCSVKYR